jgi:hypothetical protein
MTTRNITISAVKRVTPFARTRRRGIAGKAIDPTLSPLVGSSVRPVDYVLRNGFPYEPQLHVGSDYLISAEGLFIDESVMPWEADFKEAHTRFVAMENLWDPVGGRWEPLYTSGVDYYITYPLGGVEPRLDDVEYTLGKLFYQFSSVRIQEETSLISSFNSGMDDASSFMIAMAGKINSSERASLIRLGDTVGNSVIVEVDEQFYLRNQYGSATMKTTVHPAQMQPFYLVLVNNPQRTELLVSTGVSKIHHIVIPNRDATRSLVLNIGEDLDGKTTLDLNLFELTIFPYAYGGEMTPQQIIATMADVYGVS